MIFVKDTNCQLILQIFEYPFDSNIFMINSQFNNNEFSTFID